MGGLGSGEESPFVHIGNLYTEDMAETTLSYILSYLLAELESSNPQRISKKNGRSGIRRRRHLSYTLWVGDGEWEDMAETILSYSCGAGE
jgi:hypothetical protein